MAILRFAFIAVMLPAAVGCSSGASFWDRSPRVAGTVQSSPYACAPAPCQPAPCPAPRELPPPQVRSMPGCPPPASMSSPPRAACNPAAQEQEVFQHVNQIRCSQGLRQLTFNARLHAAAEAHSREQQVNGYMGHGSPDPARNTLMQRMRQAGYQGRVYGEVVAWGYNDAQGVVEGWMNSPDHRAILLDGDLSEVGFSRVGEYWTGNFGAPCGATTAPSQPQRAWQPPCPPRASRPAPRTVAPPPPTVRSVPAPSVAAPPAPRAVPRPQPRVQEYFPRQPQVAPPRPSYRPPARGG